MATDCGLGGARNRHSEDRERGRALGHGLRMEGAQARGGVLEPGWETGGDGRLSWLVDSFGGKGKSRGEFGEGRWSLDGIQLRAAIYLGEEQLRAP